MQVLATASHYWPLDKVDGIHGLWDQIGNRPGHVNGTLQIHKHTVLPSSHNSSSVYTNDSAYTNVSATVDIVEGMVNKGIYLNGDNGGTFLHFGNYQNSCISDPTLCGPEGITFSFFWKNQEAESHFAIASGGKVISNGFSVYANAYAGYVEFYTRGNSKRWRANIKIPGPFWTHILFTWTLKDGLNIYINGTFNTSDPTGNVSMNYGDPYPDLVIGTGNDQSYGRYVTGAFDEFVIWERALSPEEILMYYKAAIGDAWTYPTTASVPKEVSSTTQMPGVTDVSYSITTKLSEEIHSFQDPVPMQGFLEFLPFSLPNKTIPQDTANNLTQESTPVVSGLIETVDKVMVQMVSNLESSPSPHSLISLGGKSFVADYSLMKIPQNYNLPLYRFPTQGKNYISVPGEAFTMQSQTTIVGVFYHNMHNYYTGISPLRTRINEAADFKDHKIQVASFLISLKVEPSPALSVNLSGSPLIKIVLTHILREERERHLVTSIKSEKGNCVSSSIVLSAPPYFTVLVMVPCCDLLALSDVGLAWEDQRRGEGALGSVVKH
ncbi:unnamed protein product, partial [Coregonus sp. 'balchen']